MKSFTAIIVTLLPLAFGAALPAAAQDDVAIVERSNVPFLNCGYSRAERCILDTSGIIANCVIAAVEKGKDWKSDASCAASVTTFGANLPNDCKLCFGLA